MTSYFKGQGKRPEQAPQLPVIDLLPQRHGKGYRASADLAAAVDVALTLGLPLLLTGEPGSGKSRLADAIAWELDLMGPLRFAVKSDTRAMDLFYRFDTVGRFHASKTDGSSGAEPQRFIRFEALGQALLYAKSKAFLTDKDQLNLSEQLQIVAEHPGNNRRRSVVLIDEIDKAPRDVPNDILTEIEDMTFRIPEFEVAGGKEVRVELDSKEGETRYRPIVIITSNSERNLPDAFLRRCVYYHLMLPRFANDADNQNEDVTIEQICYSRLGDRFSQTSPLENSALALFRHLRSDAVTIGRRPGLAELLNFLELILPGKPHGVAPHDLDASKTLAQQSKEKVISAAKLTLLKEPELQAQAESLLAAWLPQR